MANGANEARLPAVGKRLRVMVVEVDALIAMDLAQTIEASGAELIGTAATADDALMLASATDPDVVVVDLSLKGREDGLSTAHAIRSRCGAAALFIAGSANADTLERVRVFNGSTPLFKPLRHSELPAAILRAFRQAEASAAESSRGSA